MVFRELKKEDGYTVAELLVALAIISIVLAMVSSVFVFVNRQMNAWNSNIGFYNNYQVVQNRMYNDLLSAESITVSDTSLVVSGLSRANTYSWENKEIRLNGTELAISEIDSLIFRLNNDPQNPGTYHWYIRQRAENKVMDQKFILHLRKPILWEPFKTNRERN